LILPILAVIDEILCFDCRNMLLRATTPEYPFQRSDVPSGFLNLPEEFVPCGKASTSLAKHPHGDGEQADEDM
jgi:hypothetical protein